MAIIVDLPILQIFTLLLSLITLALEAPLPFVRSITNQKANSAVTLTRS